MFLVFKCFWYSNVSGIQIFLVFKWSVFSTIAIENIIRMDGCHCSRDIPAQFQTSQSFLIQHLYVNVNFIPWIIWLVLSWRVCDVTIDGINQMLENWNTGFPALGHVAQPKKNIVGVEAISS